MGDFTGDTEPRWLEEGRAVFRQSRRRARREWNNLVSSVTLFEARLGAREPRNYATRGRGQRTAQIFATYRAAWFPSFTRLEWKLRREDTLLLDHEPGVAVGVFS